MNSSSKVPPRFVPTLTEVVRLEADIGAAGDESGACGTGGHHSVLDESPGRMPSQSEEPESATTVARASFHSPWLVDGLYVRSKPASIPHQLPPLPESLPPQQPFAESARVGEVMSEDFALVEASEHAIDATEAAETADLPEPGGQESLTVAALPLLSAVDAESALPMAPAAQDLSAEETTAFEVPSEGQIWGEGQEQVAQATTEEYLIQRLMQRVDLLLEKRLEEVIEQVVEAQTRALVLRLREELESVVRHSVHEAMEAELELQAQEKSQE